MDALLAFLHSLQGLPAYALLFAILVGTGFGLPMNEDILLLGAAALTLHGVMEPIPLILVAGCGVVIADGLIFHWGRVFGTRLLEHRLMARAVPPPRLLALQNLMRRWGPGTIFLARFLPGLRTAFYFAAGSLRLPYRHQFLFDALAAAIEIPLLVYGVRWLGGRWDQVVAVLDAAKLPLLAGVVLALLALWLWGRRRRV